MKPTETQTVVAGFQACAPKMAEQLGQEHLGKLLEGATLQEFPAGRTLIRDRMPVDFLYFILNGSLSASIENAGKSMQLATVHAGEWLGEISVLSGEFLASATIVTNTPCKLLKIHHLTFEKLIAEDETIAKVLLENFIELMAKRLRHPRDNP